MIRRCATCWPDPATSNWSNPGKYKIGGTSESNWVCDRCARTRLGREWVGTPVEEVFGVEDEYASDALPVPDSQPGPYETALCIEIMKRYCLGQSQRAIAVSVSTSPSYVERTIRYWRTNRGYFLENLRTMIAKTC